MNNQSTQPEVAKAEAPVKHISKIICGDITFQFDPEKMTIGQWEAVEKELIAADYYELMREHGNYCALSNIRTPMFDDKNPKDVEKFAMLSKGYDQADVSPEAVEARDYWWRRMEKAKSYSKTLQKLHGNMLKTGGRIRMICSLLTPVGHPHSEATESQVKTSVIPTMTQKEGEDVLSNFLNSPELLEHLSLNYLREYVPQKISG